ncbi:MAG: TIM barrel protein [Pseudomonadota bacterium]
MASSQLTFSAHLGFLYTHLPLVQAVAAARADGFHAVECHWPFDTPATDLAQAVQNADCPLVSLNTRRGDVAAGDNGLAAIPSRQPQARDAIGQAIAYADAVGARAVHVMAGRAIGPAAAETFLQNLDYAATLAAQNGLTILIEPLNAHDAPGYFLTTTYQAQALLRDLGRANVKLMFDCYHVARTEGDVVARLDATLFDIGHIQIAAVPDRTAPHRGTLNYADVFDALRALGWSHPIGAEFRPNADGTIDTRFMTL